MKGLENDTDVFAAKTRQTVFVERRGHGHTPDVAGSMSYSVMADDTIAYLDQVIGRPAYLIGWSDGAVIVELYADGRNGDPGGKYPMARSEALVGSVNGFVYMEQVPSNRPAGDYTPRIVPAHEGVHVPLEAGEILWQR